MATHTFSIPQMLAIFTACFFLSKPSWIPYILEYLHVYTPILFTVRIARVGSAKIFTQYQRNIDLNEQYGGYSFKDFLVSSHLTCFLNDFW